MRQPFFLLFAVCCIAVVSASAQASCKKLTHKFRGAPGNDCCINDAKCADSLLITAQENSDEIIREHAPFGLPTTKKKQVIFLYAPDYITAYDTVYNIPLWVQYKMLSKDAWRDDLSRIDCFRPDPRLPDSLKIMHADYTHSGYDRGHLMPANDAKKDTSNHINSFVMSNMAPQWANMNQKEWMAMEALLNAISRRDSVLQAYMITGSLMGDSIPWVNQKVAVPEAFYKIFFFQTDSQWHYWTFVVQNDNELKDVREFETELQERVLNIKQLEKKTGFNFKVSTKNTGKIEGAKTFPYIAPNMLYKGYTAQYD